MFFPITRFPVPGIQGLDINTRPPQDRAALGPPWQERAGTTAHGVVGWGIEPLPLRISREGEVLGNMAQDL